MRVVINMHLIHVRTTVTHAPPILFPPDGRRVAVFLGLAVVTLRSCEHACVECVWNAVRHIPIYATNVRRRRRRRRRCVFSHGMRELALAQQRSAKCGAGQRLSGVNELNENEEEKDRAFRPTMTLFQCV